MFIKPHKPASGFTIIESLVALAVVSAVSVAGLGTMSYIRHVKNRTKEVCLTRVSTTVERFRSIGYFAAIGTAPSPGVPYLGGSGNGVENLGITNTMMFPSTVPVMSSGLQPTLNNNVLITSSLNALLALYNSSGNFCSSGEIYTGTGAQGGLALPSPPAELASATLRIQIQPYETNTGSVLGCLPSPLYITPEGSVPDSASTSVYYGTTLKKATRGAGRTDIGLLLKVTQDYTDEAGATQSCAIEQRFQYGKDSTPPRAPDLKIINTQLAPPTGACVPNVNNRFEIQLGYQNYDIEPGSVMVCRDISTYVGSPIASSDIAPTYSQMGCQWSSGLPNIIVGPGYTPPPAGQTGRAFGPGHTSAMASRQWVSCDRVTACGVAPTSATMTTGSRPRYSLIYNNLPPYCRVNIQFAAIDTASNSSDNIMTASQAGDPTLFESSSNSAQWDIPAPRCGNLCTYSMPYYFRCGSCYVY